MTTMNPPLTWERGFHGLSTKLGVVNIRVGNQGINGCWPYLCWVDGDKEQSGGEESSFLRAREAAIALAMHMSGPPQIVFLRGLNMRTDGDERMTTLSRGLSATLATMDLKHLDRKVRIELFPDGYAFVSVNNPTQNEQFIIKGILLGLYFGMTGISK